MNYIPKKIGTVTIPAGMTQMKTYECAAWYTMIELTPGTYDLIGLYEKLGYGYAPHVQGKEELRWVMYTVPGTVTEDYFPALFGGVRVGSP